MVEPIRHYSWETNEQRSERQKEVVSSAVGTVFIISSSLNWHETVGEKAFVFLVPSAINTTHVHTQTTDVTIRTSSTPFDLHRREWAKGLYGLSALERRRWASSANCRLAMAPDVTGPPALLPVGAALMKIAKATCSTAGLACSACRLWVYSV